MSFRPSPIHADRNLISKDEDVSEILNDYFKNAVTSLDINENKFLLTESNENSDPIDHILKTYRFHPSVLKIKGKVPQSKRFFFHNVTLSDIENELQKLNTKKSSTLNNIPTNILKSYADLCSGTLHNIFNESLNNGCFPDELKLADITPIFKKGDATNEKNYRPISVLPVVSKVFERLLQAQISSYFETYLSPHLCGYRKGYNAQHALITLINKFKSSLDKQGYAGAILMDLSKAFDTLNHDLLLAKLNAYGFDKQSLLLIKSYLTNRWQRTRIGTTFSSWSELLSGVPQGSVLGPLLFNIYINDLIFTIEQTSVCNYADDTTLYDCDQNLDYLIKKLEHDSTLAIEWFESNYMKLNHDKCHFIMSGHKHEYVFAKIGQKLIWEERNVKLLGIDSNLLFNKHVRSLYMKASRKLSALTRVVKFMNLQQRRTLMKAFVVSQFNYCPLLWMFHSRTLNNRINNLHERALRIVYKDDDSSFKEFLVKDGSCTIHHYNLKLLAVEMYKVKNNLSPEFMQDIFPERNIERYNLRKQVNFQIPGPKTVTYGTESIQFLGSKIWNLIPNDLKSATNLSIFKANIKKWIPNDCPCRLCKDYIVGVGFMNPS